MSKQLIFLLFNTPHFYFYCIFIFFLFIFITFLWFFISLDMSKQLFFLLFNTAHFYFYCIFILCLWTYQIGIFPQKIWNFYEFKQILQMDGRKLAVLSLNRVLISFSFLLHLFSTYFYYIAQDKSKQLIFLSGSIHVCCVKFLPNTYR